MVIYCIGKNTAQPPSVHGFLNPVIWHSELQSPLSLPSDLKLDPISLFRLFGLLHATAHDDSAHLWVSTTSLDFCSLLPLTTLRNINDYFRPVPLYDW